MPSDVLLYIDLLKKEFVSKRLGYIKVFLYLYLKNQLSKCYYNSYRMIIFTGFILEKDKRKS